VRLGGGVVHQFTIVPYFVQTEYDYKWTYKLLSTDNLYILETQLLIVAVFVPAFLFFLLVLFVWLMEIFGMQKSPLIPELLPIAGKENIAQHRVLLYARPSL
jgi:hypothetical protein